MDSKRKSSRNFSTKSSVRLEEKQRQIATKFTKTKAIAAKKSEGESSTVQAKEIEVEVGAVEKVIEEQFAEEPESSAAFFCLACKKNYANVSSLNNHMKKHAGRRWKCSRCDAEMVSKYAYKRHMERSHKYRKTVEDSADEKEVYVHDDVAQMTNEAKDRTLKKLTKKVAMQKGTISYLRARIKELKQQNVLDESGDSTPDESDSMSHDEFEQQEIQDVAVEETQRDEK